MQEELTTPIEGTMVPPDEIIKLQCLQMATDYRAADVIAFAREMYKWVKEGSSNSYMDDESPVPSRQRFSIDPNVDSDRPS